VLELITPSRQLVIAQARVLISEYVRAKAPEDDKAAATPAITDAKRVFMTIPPKVFYGAAARREAAHLLHVTPHAAPVG